jgi:hypothetical protein
VDPDNFMAGGVTRTVQYRNKETGKIVAKIELKGSVSFVAVYLPHKSVQSTFPI